MQGTSRAAVAAGDRAFTTALAAAPAAGLAEDLFGVLGSIDGTATLRRALTDPSREGSAKTALANAVFAGKVSSAASDLVATLAAQRWSHERDLGDALEGYAVQALVAGAEQDGTADQLEDELFRFERIVAANAGLRDALTDRTAEPARKADLVRSLLHGKSLEATHRLARQAATAARGQRFDRQVARYLEIASTRRNQLSATVVCAVDLTAAQRDRLGAALEQIYGKTVHLNVVVDETVIGGIRVVIGDDVVDGTILRKLDAAKRHFGV